jgi:predicted nucleic acid-binding protein
MAIISNTSPLIALAQIGRLELLKDLYEGVIIPPFVRVECVDKGKVLGAKDAYEIEKRIQEGWISVIALERRWKTQSKSFMRHSQIGQGEAEAIIVAKEKRMPVILDDTEARAVAGSLGIRHMGTVMIPYEAYVREIVSYNDLVRILSNLSKVLWVSPTVIAEILRRAGEVRK